MERRQEQTSGNDSGMYLPFWLCYAKICSVCNQ